MQEQPNQASEQPEDQANSFIETVDDMAKLVMRWHKDSFNDLKNLFNVPEGVEVTIEHEDGEEAPDTIVLEGHTMLAFKTGIHSAMNLLGKLPFAVVVDITTKSEEADKASITEDKPEV